MRYLYLIVIVIFYFASPLVAQVGQKPDLYIEGLLALDVLKPGCGTHDMAARQEVRRIKVHSGRRISICRPILPAPSAPDSVTSRTAINRNCRIISFNISDEETGEPVQGATITLTSTESRDSLRFFADEKGHVQTDAVSLFGNYTMHISSVGYKTHFSNQQLNSDTVFAVKLSREIKENAAIVVIGYGRTRCRCVTCDGVFASICRLNIDSSTVALSTTPVTHLYPNPVRRGAIVRIETAFTTDAMIQVRITNLTGATLSTMSYKPVKGANRMEIPVASHWSAGVYFMQLINPTGKLLTSQKIIIQ